MGEHRATGSWEKEARRRQILEAAAELLQSWSFTDITMDRIAELAGVAKGTLYLYFRTKESLFLTLYEDRLRAWYSELYEIAIRTGGTVKSPDAARVIASTLMARPILRHLHGLLHSALGHNIDLDTMVEFRRRQHGLLSSLAPALARRIDGVSDDDSLRFLIRLEWVVGGLSSAASASPALSRALDEQDLEIFHIDFEKELTEMIAALLR